MTTAYTYNDVLIKPKYSEVLSRSDVKLNTRVGKIYLNLPVISSNMKTVTGPKMAFAMSCGGGLGILHRFNTTDQAVKEYKEFFDIVSVKAEKGKEYQWPGVSIGVKEEDKKRFDELYMAGARIFCIDVAHGHHIHVKKMLQYLNTGWGDVQSRLGITIIAGNIATPEAYRDMVAWGADAVKVGIGPSPVCRTRYNTGVGVPQLYALETVYNESIRYQNPISIIADGGVTHVGDIAKALKFADAVMIGSVLAGTSESPGQVFRNEDGEFYKVYGGSASGENKGENRFVEGIIKTVKFKGKVKYILREIEQGLQSAFSYVGALNHQEFQQNCEFEFISNGAQKESKI